MVKESWEGLRAALSISLLFGRNFVGENSADVQQSIKFVRPSCVSSVWQKHRDQVTKRQIMPLISQDFYFRPDSIGREANEPWFLCMCRMHRKQLAISKYVSK